MNGKKEEYTNYIKEHQSNVRLAWSLVQPKLTGDFWLDDFNWHTINDLVKIHDDSKFSVREFEGYQQWFFPRDGEIKNKDIFNISWLHHKNSNPHHWNYWILDTIPLQMPFIYIFEMLLDWTGMSIKFKDSPDIFWNKNKERMILHGKTIEVIENWIEVFIR